MKKYLMVIASYPDWRQEFFENLHPDIKESMENLHDLYSSFISNFTPEKPNPLNIFSAGLFPNQSAALL